MIRALVAALALSALAGCSTKAESREPLASCTMPPAVERSIGAVPADFPHLEGTTLTDVQVKKAFVATQGFAKRSVEELFEQARPVLIEKGFDIVNSDFEGFEAELYFAKGNELAGIVSLREAPCDGYVKVNVLYDPLETEAGRKAVRKTRNLSGS